MELNPLLRRAVDLGASDIHLKVGVPPILRRDGALGPLEEAPVVTDADTEAVLAAVGKRSPERYEAFKQSGDLDIAYQEEDLPRFRVNAFRQRGHISFAFRVTPKHVPNFEMLNLPQGIRRLAEEHRGLVLVTGATGSGKTTTLAAIIDHINRSRQQHIVTIEDPIEILHSDHSCIVNQREVGLDTTDFMQALRRALRQDPDVILIGELRDAETAQTALQAAESGHLVLSTLHTVDAAETIGRMVEFFPEAKQEMIRSVMAGVLARRDQPAPAAARRWWTRRRGRGDGHQHAHRRSHSREQARGDHRRNRGRLLLRHADLHQSSDRPRRRRPDRPGGRRKCRDEPP